MILARILPCLLASVLGHGAGAEVEAVSWSVRWDDGDAIRTTDGVRLYTDEGFVVHLDELSVVEHTVSLVPCEAPTERLGVLSWLGGEARADHPPIDDPSAVAARRPVDAIHDVEAPLGAVRLAPTRYCQAHWLLGRVGAEGDRTWRDTALRVRGTWAKGIHTGRIEVDVPWSQGALTPWPTDAPRGADVTVVRTLDGLLDGVDLAESTPLEVAWAMMVHLTETTRLEVSPLDPA